MGYEIEDISTAEEIAAAKVIVFPGVGIFGQAMESLRSKGWLEPLRAYIRADRPFFGICIGMQSLFEGSDESPEFEGLGVIPGRITRFHTVGPDGTKVRVPQMGWNGISPVQSSVVLENTKPGDSVGCVSLYRCACVSFSLSLTRNPCPIVRSTLCTPSAQYRPQRTRTGSCR